MIKIVPFVGTDISLNRKYYKAIHIYWSILRIYDKKYTIPLHETFYKSHKNYEI